MPHSFCAADRVMREIESRHARVAAFELPVGCIAAQLHLFGPLLQEIREEYARYVFEKQSALQGVTNTVLQVPIWPVASIRKRH